MPKRPPSKSRPRDLSVAFVSLGCPKNLVDSEKMLGLLAEDGIAITDDHDSADAIVINTCGFLEASKTESLEVIREAVAAKTRAAKKGAAKRVIVAGCLVQRHRENLLQETPDVDALVGVFDRAHIVHAVRGSNPSDHLARGGNRRPSPSDTPPSGRDPAPNLGPFHAVTTFISKPTRAAIGKGGGGYLESDRARLRLTPRHYTYLRVSEGCNQGCTFCTIPSIRGRMRSKPLPAILAEARELLADGTRELNLIGQDTTSYGTDIGYKEGLPGLLRALNNLAAQHSLSASVPPSLSASPPWLRLMYAYPSCFTDDMIHTLADCPHVVKYIDIPLQHINDQLLHTMRRKVTRKQTETLLEKLRRHVPGIALRTTFISGFPTETDAQHAELLQFVTDFRFDNVGVFEFSPEPGTPAGRLHQTAGISSKIAAHRKQQIMLAQQKIVFQLNASLIGTTLPVLIDDVNPRQNTATARHPAQAPDIDGTVLLKNASHLSPGDLLSAQITAYDGYDLIATPTTVPLAPSPRRRVAASTPSRLSLPVLSLESRGKRG